MIIELWTDGSVCENSKSSGWACVFLSNNKILKKLSGNLKNKKTTEIEIIAVIKGLKYYQKFLDKKHSLLNIYTDYKHICDVINKKHWKKWKDNEHSKYWDELLYLLLDFNRNKIEFNWIPSHSGYYFNELADKMAKKARYQKNE